jgi:hypothetical protein
MTSPYLKYRTFDQLLADAIVDLPKQNQEGFIEPAQLIKVALTCNYKMGLKIQQEKEVVLDVYRGKARLPVDLFTLNFAKVCVHYTIEQSDIQGTHSEDVILDRNCEPDGCGCKVTSLCNGSLMYVKQTFKGHTKIFDGFVDIYIQIGTQISDQCPNSRIYSELQGKIKHGFLYTNFDSGTIYINYMGNMEDEDGNLLVPDHPVLNEYYEYALKQRILENMFLAKEDVANALQFIEARFRTAKYQADSLVNMPDFKDLKQVWEINRKAQLKRYYSIFS